MAEEIPDAVLRLLEQIEDYEQLEALLLLHTNRDAKWTLETIASRLGISRTDAETALEQLCKLRFARVTVVGVARTFEYFPGGVDADKAVQDLMLAYREQRVAVVKLMNMRAIERLRTSALRTFADAFLLGGKKKDG